MEGTLLCFVCVAKHIICNHKTVDYNHATLLYGPPRCWPPRQMLSCTTISILETSNFFRYLSKIKVNALKTTRVKVKVVCKQNYLSKK